MEFTDEERAVLGESLADLYSKLEWQINIFSRFGDTATEKITSQNKMDILNRIISKFEEK